MGIIRFSESGKEYLRGQMDVWAKSIAAHLLGSLTGITSDHHVIAMAMDEFPPILRERLVDVLDDIDSNIKANGLLEEFECGRQDRGQVQFSVTLDGLADPAKKISVIKAVREVTLLGLKEAKDMVEGAPAAAGTIKSDISRGEANKLKKKLEDAGGRVSIK